MYWSDKKLDRIQKRLREINLLEVKQPFWLLYERLLNAIHKMVYKFSLIISSFNHDSMHPHKKQDIPNHITCIYGWQQKKVQYEVNGRSIHTKKLRNVDYT